jgi:hypothetical protein
MDEIQELHRLALEVSEEHRARVAAMIADVDRSAPMFWEPGEGEEIRVPVEGGDIRVFACRPPSPEAKRPIVLVPGWGVVPEGFREFYQLIHGKAEFYYVETREKGSSRLSARWPDMSPRQSARDIGAALDALGLHGRRDFVLVGACWGAALIIQGLLDGAVDAPTIVAFDPIHRLWFPKWILRWVAPVVPAFLVGAARWLFVSALIGDMQEQSQKARDYAFVRAAVPGKWKRAAYAARDLELFGTLGGIARELFVVNASNDRVHEQTFYPRIAGELPRGRFLYLPTDESDRERCMAASALEFARVSASEGLPPRLAYFEKRVR